MNLPSYELDNFILENGEEINRDYPETFWIPGKEQRVSLKPGDIVKLVFNMEESNGSEDVSIERMWVIIDRVNLPYYIGTLDNNPEGSTCVKAGQQVVFQPCHIIDIYEE